jgi:hypothetical protein
MTSRAALTKVKQKRKANLLLHAGKRARSAFMADIRGLLGTRRLTLMAIAANGPAFARGLPAFFESRAPRHDIRPCNKIR